MMNKEFWRSVTFKPHGYTSLICPTCSIGRLTILDGAYSSKETKASYDNYKFGEGMRPDDTVKLFSVLLTCNNTECLDVIACLGMEHCDMQMNYVLNPPDLDCIECCEPNYFHPPLKIID